MDEQATIAVDRDAGGTASGWSQPVLERFGRLWRCPHCADRAWRFAQTGLGCEGCGRRYGFGNGYLDFLDAENVGDEVQTAYWEEEEVYRPVTHVVARGFAEQRWDFVRRVLPMHELRTALDVGSGNGLSTLPAEGLFDAVFSLDASRRLLAESPARLRMRGDALRLPFADRSVDLVYSWELLHHLDEPYVALLEMKRVARRLIYFFEPNRWNPAQVAFALLSPPNRATLRNTRRFFAEQIARAGLRVRMYRSVGWLTANVPPVWAYRVLRRMPFCVPWVGVSHFYVLEPN